MLFVRLVLVLTSNSFPSSEQSVQDATEFCLWLLSKLNKNVSWNFWCDLRSFWCIFAKNYCNCTKLFWTVICSDACCFFVFLAVLVFETRESKTALDECPLRWRHMPRLGPNIVQLAWFCQVWKCAPLNVTFLLLFFFLQFLHAPVCQVSSVLSRTPSQKRLVGNAVTACVLISLGCTAMLPDGEEQIGHLLVRERK